MSIDCCSRTGPQHGMQQQMQVVSCLQQPKKLNTDLAEEDSFHC